MSRECLKDNQVKAVNGGYLTPEAQDWWNEHKQSFVDQNPMQVQLLEKSFDTVRSGDTTLDALKQWLLNLGFHLPEDNKI